MRSATLCAVLVLIAAAPAPARVAIGQYGAWGAFREGAGLCFAVAEPLRRGRGAVLPHVTVAFGRGGGLPRLDVVPSRALRPGAGVVLEIGSHRFPWSQPADLRAGARIVAALRRADRLRVIGEAAGGRHFHDDYALAGAPSAIDAAIIGCL